jgi:hypothetical protein
MTAIAITRPSRFVGVTRDDLVRRLPYYFRANRDRIAAGWRLEYASPSGRERLWRVIRTDADASGRIA